MKNAASVAPNHAAQVADYRKLFDLKGRGFVVLGSGLGIGKETCRALTQAGGRVLCVDRDGDVASEVAREIGGAALVADLTKRADVEAIFQRAQQNFGDRFSGFVHVAGTAVLKSLDELDDDDWSLQFEQVLGHARLAMQSAARLLRTADNASVTFVGSLTAIKTFRKQIAYGAAKAALHHFVRGCAVELGPTGLRVNAVAPGFVKTPFLLARLSEPFWSSVDSSIPLRRVATPIDIASAILFLQSDLARYVTGQVLVLDGGLGYIPACPMI